MRQLLDGILERNGVHAPDRRPLYAYNVTLDQLNGLRERLASRAHRASRFDRFEAAGFCLHASHAFCDGHIDGSWAWATVTAPLRMAPVHSVLAELVEEGLSWWRRKVLPINDRRHFLVTVACEGGLPRALIARDGVYLRTFYARLLADRERYPGTPIEALLDRHQHLLPTTLRNAIVRELSAALVTRIAELRQIIGDAAQPIALLDAQHPRWRDQIPLQLQDDLALDLFRGLLGQPHARNRSANAQITVDAFLRDSGGTWTFAREPVIPPELRASELATQLGVAADALPPGFVLHLQASDGATYRAAIATLVGGTDEDRTYRLEAHGQALPSDDPRTLDVLRLVAIANGRVIGSAVPFGGERLDESPWIFSSVADADGRCELIGLGSVRSRRASVIVAVPESVSISVTGGCEDLGRTGPAKRVTLAPGVSSAPALGTFKVYRVSGRATVGDDDVSYVIQTGSEAELGRSCVLEGQRIPLGHGGSEVWRGVPSVEIREDGFRTHVRAHELDWRSIATQSGYRRVGADCIGDVELRCQRNGETVCRFRATVLPAATQITLRPSVQHGRGSVVIEGARVTKVDVGVAAGVVGQALVLNGNAEIELAAVDRVPATVPLWLQLAGGARATIDVPFPAVATLFVGTNGEALASGATVSVESLLGMRVQVVTPSAAAKCQLTACLFGNAHANANDAADLRHLHASRRDLAHLTRDTLGRHVLLLDDVYESVRQLLAMSTDLDAFVQLRVELLGAGPGPGRNRELKVKRYDAWFMPASLDDGVLSVTISESVTDIVGTNVVESLTVEAFPIWTPDETATRVPLTRVDGAWTMDLVGRMPGPWFVVGRQGGHVRFRPLLVNIPGVAEDDGPTSMRAGMNIEAKPERREALDATIDRLAKDGRDSDWACLWHVLHELDELPPTTYDVVDRLIRNPDATALTALSAGPKLFPSLWAKLEELPFMWSLVPVRSWLRAVQVFRRSYESRSEALRELPGGWQQLFESAVVQRFAEIAHRAPWFNNVWDVAAQLMADVPPPDPEQRFVSKVRQGASLVPFIELRRTEIRQRHAQDTYPQGELASLFERVPGALREALEYRPPIGCGFEHDAINAPFLAATSNVFALEVTRPAIFDLTRLRSFDRYGFDALYELLLAQILGHQLRTKGEHFDARDA